MVFSESSSNYIVGPAVQQEYYIFADHNDILYYLTLVDNGNDCYDLILDPRFDENCKPKFTPLSVSLDPNVELGNISFDVKESLPTATVGK